MRQIDGIGEQFRSRSIPKLLQMRLLRRLCIVLSLVFLVVIGNAKASEDGGGLCPHTDDPVAVGLRAALSRCAHVERGGKLGDIRSITVDDSKAAAVIDLLDANATLLRMSAPRRELSPIAGGGGGGKATNRWSQHAPDDASIVADVGCDPRFENRAMIEVEQRGASVRVQFLVVENVREALATTTKRISETAAREVALKAAKDFGDEQPALSRSRLYLTRRDCRFDPRTNTTSFRRPWGG